jgi:hypothetical protein
MFDIPIHNETEFPLTSPILEQIKQDAVEYFGDSVRSIRVQYGIDRHAYNAKTGEIRYAFSPGDFGLHDTSGAIPDPYFSRGVPSIDDDTEEADEQLDEITYDEVDDDVDIEQEDETETSLEELGEDLEDIEDEEDVDIDALTEPFDEEDEEEEEFTYDEEEYN